MFLLGLLENWRQHNLCLRLTDLKSLCYRIYFFQFDIFIDYCCVEYSLCEDENSFTLDNTLWEFDNIYKIMAKTKQNLFSRYVSSSDKFELKFLELSRAELKSFQAKSSWTLQFLRRNWAESFIYCNMVGSSPVAELLITKY